MNYEQLEASIVARLSPLNLLGVECIPLPEVDVDVLLPSTKGKVTVAYLKSKFDLSVDTHVVAQPETISFQLVIQSRKLRGSIGIYNILKSVKSLLLGWKSDVTGKIHFDEAGIVDHESSIWTYRLNLTTQNLAIEEPNDVVYPIATLITLDPVDITGVQGEPIDIGSELAKIVYKGTTFYDGTMKKYFKSDIEQGLELVDVIDMKYLLQYFIVKNTTGNSIAVNLGTTLGGNEVVGMSVDVAPFSTVTVSVHNEFSPTSNQSLFLSSPDWNGASIDILLISIEGI